MLSPVSMQETSAPSFQRQTPSSVFLPTSSPSTLKSMEAQKKEQAMESIKYYVSAVPAFFSRLIFSGLNFLKRMFGLATLPKIPVANLSTFSPSSLDPQDPFRKEVFLIDANGNWECKNKKAFTLVSYIFFSQLGTLGPWGWLWNKKKIKEAEKELVRSKQHPCEFLYFIFMNPVHTSHLVHFKNHATGSLIDYICKRYGEENPWKTFLRYQARNFAHRKKEEILPFIPGFCQSLNLEKDKIESFVKAGRWEEMILYIYEKRKEQFQT